MYHKLTPQIKELRKLLGKIPSSNRRKTRRANLIVDELVRPAGEPNTGIYYAAAGVIIGACAGAEDFAREFDKLVKRDF